jgi:hypothetical protein
MSDIVRDLAMLDEAGALGECLQLLVVVSVDAADEARVVGVQVALVLAVRQLPERVDDDREENFSHDGQDLCLQANTCY